MDNDPHETGRDTSAIILDVISNDRRRSSRRHTDMSDWPSYVLCVAIGIALGILIAVKMFH